MKDKEKQIEFIVIDNNTGKQADISEIALKEDWAKGLMYCDMEGFAINENGQLVLIDECGNFAYCPYDRFTVKFENSVVLSREELEKIINQTKETEKNYYKKVVIPQSSKETAEKFIGLRKYITQQFHNYHEARDKAEAEYKKCKEEIGKAVLNNDWHRADAIMFILEQISIEFDRIIESLKQ